MNKINNKLLILIFTIFSVFFINRYEFGVDYAVLLPFVKKIMKPELFPSDYFIEQLRHYPTLLWYIVGYLCKITHIKLEILLFIFYFISIYFFFLGFYLLSGLISNSEEVAILSLFLLLFQKHSFALVETIPTSFYNRTPVLPILLFSIYYFLKRNYYLSFLILGIGFLIHPMSASYIFFILLIAVLFEVREKGIKRFLFSLLILLIISAPIIIFGITDHLKISFIPDKNWLEMLRLRSSHHIFPFSWDKMLFIEGLFIFISLIISLKYKVEKWIFKKIIIIISVILLLCMIGTIFTEIFPLTFVLLLQLFRSFIFLIYISIIMVCNFYFKSYSKERNYIEKIASLFLIFLLIYNGKIWKLGYFLIICFSIFLAILQFKIKENLLRYTILIFLIFVIILSLYSVIVKSKMDFWCKDYEDVQRWAKENTKINDVFIVPPHLCGFRIYSERSIYTDWKDGTMLNFNPEFGSEWIRRMENLGIKDKKYPVKGYNVLKKEDFLRISEEIFKWQSQPKTVYVVVNKRKNLDLIEVYSNSFFKVYRIDKSIF